MPDKITDPHPIKDHMDRGIEVVVEDGKLVINHVGGKLQMFGQDVVKLMGELGKHVPHLHLKPEDDEPPEPADRV